MLGLLHSLAAVAAIIAGGIVVYERKGSRTHVRYGRMYVAAMALLNSSALGIYRITGEFGLFHVCALLSLATLFAGVALLWLFGTTDRGLYGHGYCMLWSYAGLLAAAVSEFATHLLDWPSSTGVVGMSLAVFIVGGAMIHTLGGRTIRRTREGSMSGGSDRRPGPAGG
jgi:uncharacterized membrane protein